MQTNDANEELQEPLGDGSQESPVEKSEEGLGTEAPDHAADHDEVLDDVLREEPPQPKSDSQRVQAAEQEVLRIRAEMENFRKRMQRESEQQLKYANMPLMRDLLEVCDNLKRATDAADGDDPSTQALRDGVSMVSQQLTDVLAKFGCKQVEALGQPFDPNVHEAISQLASEEFEKGMVMNEVAVGYTLHDRVVRPSHVVVSAGNGE